MFLFFFVVSAITTIACGYTEKNATGNVLLLFLLLLLAHRNTLTSITALLFLFCCALYAPAGMTYGKINNSFIVALLQTTTDEAAEFTGMIPVYHFLVSAAIQVFMVIFWRTHRRGHRNWLALLLFVLCSVNSWPLRMVKGTVVGTTDTLREMQRYKQLNQHGADNWKILPGVPLYDTIVIVTGESVRRDYMSVYGYPVPTTPWLNTAPGLFIDGYTSAAASTVPSLSRTLIYDYEQNPDSGNNVVALAAKAGYSTWWISNQGKLGEHDTRISVIASDAEHTVFLKKGSFASRKTDDMLLLQETERALADKSSPKVIFLHMMGSHPNPCDRLHSWPNNYQEQFPRKIACYLASISKLDNFLGQLDGILRRHSRHFAMLYFSDHGLSVSDSANPVHHDGHVQGGYSVPLIITASDITSHQSVSRKISARHFAGIFQWLTGIRTENIPPFNLLTDEDNEPVMVFNGERNVPADSLKPQPLILPVKENKRNVHHQIMYDEFSTVYSNYLAHNQTGVTRPTENTGEVITRWQRKSGFFDVSHNVFDNKAL